MPDEGASQADRDLLARLNALRKTHIDLDDKLYRIPVTAHIEPPVDPSPARSLYSDLVSRFKTLNGTKPQNGSIDASVGEHEDNVLAKEDSKTIEELFDELGGEGAWNVEKDEATQIDDLLRSADSALKDAKANTGEDEYDERIPGDLSTHYLPSVDIEFSRPDHDADHDNASDDEGARKSKQEVEHEINREADDLIAKLKDELKNAPAEPSSDHDDDDGTAKISRNPNLPAAPAFDLPSIPSTDPEPTAKPDIDSADNDLASRFASLSLPSNPSTTLPSAPSSKPGSNTTTRFGTTSKHEGYTADEIDSWCIICCEDATLRCVGCDGDLYCAKCWIEGHRGPDAGYEERTHKALEFNKGVKKERRRKLAA